MAILKKLGRRKRRYPIKRDEEGKSGRQRCFEMFEQHLPHAEIAKATGVTIDTVYTYHRQWKKNPRLETQQAFFKKLLDKRSPNRDRHIELVARYVGVIPEELQSLLQKPHGLKRMMTEKIYFPAQSEADHKRYVALQLGMLVSDHVIDKGGKFEDVYFALAHLMKAHQRAREEEDKHNEEENKITALMHRVLQADLENERQGRVQPDKLSEEEINTIKRWAVRRAKRGTEAAYWLRIGELMGSGLTIEQARDKICQDLIDKGDLEGAKEVREYMNRIDPLKTDGRSSPLPPGPLRKQEEQ